MRSLGSIFSGASIVFLGMVIDKGVSFGGRALIARYLSPLKYGEVGLGVTVMTFLASISLLGLHDGLSRYLPRLDSRGRTLSFLLSAFQSAMPLAILLGISVTVFAGSIAEFLRVPDISPLLRIAGFGIPVIVLFKLTTGAVRGAGRAMPRVYMENIAMPVTKLVSFAIVIVLGLGTSVMLWGYVIAYSVAAVLGVYFLYTLYLREGELDLKEQEGAFSLFDSKSWRSLLQFSAPLLLAGLMFRVLSDIDVFLLSYFTSSPRPIGIYQAIYPLGSLLTLFLLACNYMVLPIFSELESRGNNNEMRESYRTLTKWIFVVSLPVFVSFLVFPNLLISMTFGEAYTSGSTALQILAAGFLFHIVTGPNGETLQAIGRSKTVMMDNATVAVSNVVFNIVLIPRFQLVGAIVATFLGYVLWNVLMSYQLYRETKIRPITGGEVLVPFLLSLGAVLFTFMPFAPDVSTFLFFVVFMFVYGVIYSTVIFRYVIDTQDISLLEDVEQKVGTNLQSLKTVIRLFSNSL